MACAGEEFRDLRVGRIKVSRNLELTFGEPNPQRNIFRPNGNHPDGGLAVAGNDHFLFFPAEQGFHDPREVRFRIK
jgi:hypothetical protein